MTATSRAIAADQAPAPPQTSTIVCVLGMHRSGTSALTGVLQRLGVDIGPEHYRMLPAADNPRGFWEHQRLTNFNDEILATLGGTWATPPELASGWEQSPALDDLHARVTRQLTEDFGSSPVWGWKDPRTCLTLPFWQRIVTPQRYVIALRNPVDVAHSLAQRNGLAADLSVNLWLRYIRDALVYSAGSPRLFVTFDALVERGDVEVARLAAFVSPLTVTPEARQHATALVETELRHHRATPRDLVRESDVPYTVRALYASLHLIAEAQRAGRDTEDDIDALATVLAEHAVISETTAARVSQDHDTRLRQADTQLADARERSYQQATQLIALYEEKSEAVRQAVQLTVDVTRLADTVARLGDEGARLTSEVTRLHGDVTQLHGDVARLHGEVAARQDEVARLDAERTRLSDELTRQHAVTAELQNTVAHLYDAVSHYRSVVPLFQMRAARLRVRLARLRTPMGVVNRVLRTVLPHRFHARLRRMAGRARQRT